MYYLVGERGTFTQKFRFNNTESEVSVTGREISISVDRELKWSGSIEDLPEWYPGSLVAFVSKEKE
jgi:hypothetical protein